MDEFDKRLKELRLEQGKTQKEIAEMLRIPQRTYSNYEQGKAEPDLKLLSSIADLYETSTDFLLGRDFIRDSSKKSEMDLLFEAIQPEYKEIVIRFLESLNTAKKSK